MASIPPNLYTLLQQGIQAHAEGNYINAEALYLQVLEAQPDHPDALHLLGVLAFHRGNLDIAISLIEEAISYSPAVAIYHFNLGHAYQQANEMDKAEYCYQAVVQLDPDFAKAYYYLGRLYYQRHRLELAAPLYQKAIQLGQQNVSIYMELATMLQKQNWVEGSLYYYQQALELEPDNLEIQIIASTVLPKIYRYPEEIQHYRQQFIQGLDFLTSLPVKDPAVAEQVFRALSPRQLNFSLSYQGQDDRSLQARFGRVVHDMMQCLYPEWHRSRPLPPVTDRIRIGYLSSCFCRHTVGRLALGWIREHDSNRFEVYCYHVGSSTDPFTEEVRQVSTQFYHLPELDRICQQILKNQPHILVILDIGMVPLTQLVAALRLAPIQCTTWMHPVTSGLPTIDYYLSSDLMEPNNGNQHYTETLVRLPNLGIRYAYPTFPGTNKSREDFGLHPGQIVYLCCQSMAKYLPQYDYLFAKIAQRVPQAKFVFLGDERSRGIEIFRQRLHDAFGQFDLVSDTHCHILPFLAWHDYVSLNRLSDIFLDSILWSGGQTTLEAIACDLPVVTYPGPLMRGRHTYAILRLLGLQDTIAQSEQDYVNIAVELGQNDTYREQLVKQIQDSKTQVFEDREGLRGLEQFYETVVNGFVTA